MEKSAKLLLVHTNHLPEQDVDRMMDMLNELGVHMAQLIASGRPGRSEGYTVLIEIEEKEEWRVAMMLASSFGISGYHRLETTHCYQPVNKSERAMVIVSGEKQLGVTVHYKLIGIEAKPLYVHIDDSDLEGIKIQVQEKMGMDVPVSVLREGLEPLLMDLNGFVCELDHAPA